MLQLIAAVLIIIAIIPVAISIAVLVIVVGALFGGSISIYNYVIWFRDNVKYD